MYLQRKYVICTIHTINIGFYTFADLKRRLY